MRLADRVKSISSYVSSTYKKKSTLKEYPHEILDLVIFHKIHVYMDEEAALQSYRRLKSNFVDWNEVRISSLCEIHETLGGSSDSLELAIFIKGLLEFLHQKCHAVDLEFLAEENISEIRRFLKQIKGMDPATINMILRVRKDYPVLPVNSRMEQTFLRLGVVRPGDTRDQKGRYLHGLVSEEIALPFHHFFLEHSREICPPDEERLQCSTCGIRSSCSYYTRKHARKKTRRR